MTNEEFQRTVLEELRKLNGKVDNLEKGQEDIKRDQKYMWEDIKKIDNRLEKQEIKLKKVAP